MAINLEVSTRAVDSIATLLQLDKQKLLSMVQILEQSPLSLYAAVRIRKGNGLYRQILVPTHDVKLLQSKIKKVCFKTVVIGEYCHGFTHHRSVVTNAKHHVGSRLAVSMDFSDFFGSINGNKVFDQFRGLCQGSEIAYVFTLVCTVANSGVDATNLANRFLPQGTATSPVLSNMCASNFDYRVAALLKKKLSAWTYTRYADDLTFSTTDGSQDVGRVLSSVQRISCDEGFSIAPNKTHVERDPLSISVTGILVNPNLHLSRDYLRRIRAAVHRLNTDKTVRSSYMKSQALKLSGMLSYLASVNFDQFDNVYHQLNLHENEFLIGTPISNYFWSTREYPKAIDRRTLLSVRRNIYKLETTRAYMSSYRLKELRENLIQIRTICPVKFTSLAHRHRWLTLLLESEAIPTTEALGLPFSKPKSVLRPARIKVLKKRFVPETSLRKNLHLSAKQKNNPPFLLHISTHQEPDSELHKVKQKPLNVPLENWFDGKIVP